MFIRKTVAIFLVLTLMNLFVNCGPVSRSTKQEVDKQMNTEVDSLGSEFIDDVDRKPDFNAETFSEQQWKDALDSDTTNYGTTDLLSRSNFGDLPVKCGPNEERIHGECHQV